MVLVVVFFPFSPVLRTGAVIGVVVDAEVETGSVSEDIVILVPRPGLGLGLHELCYRKKKNLLL